MTLEWPFAPVASIRLSFGARQKIGLVHMDENDVLSNVCRLALHYYTESQSPISLLQQSGYLSAPQAISCERVTVFLREHPELIESWKTWAEDARSAWCEQAEGGYRVFAGPSAKPIEFTDRFEAWAEVVVRNIRHLAA